MIADFNWMEAIRTSPAMIALIVCSVVTLGITLERAYYFRKRSGDPDATLAEALKRLQTGDVKEASWAFEKSPHPVGVVAVEVLRHLSDRFEAIEERMQIALSQQKLLLERNLNVLGTMAATAPLIGLLGTVWGIMRAFHDMASTGSAAPTVVAAGVSEALVTTGAGLVVAIPALMFYNHFSRRMNVMLTIAENHSRSVRAIASETGKPGTPDKGGSAPTPRTASIMNPTEPEPVTTR